MFTINNQFSATSLYDSGWQKWWLYDNWRGDEFITAMSAKTREEAIEEGIREWRKLTKEERNQRLQFQVVFASEELEDGLIDWETCFDSIDIKALGEAPRYRVDLIEWKARSGVSCITTIDNADYFMNKEDLLSYYEDYLKDGYWVELRDNVTQELCATTE